jgi:transposase InsO family protein
MKYSFIAEHASRYPVERQCAALGVSVSGYYAWHKRTTSQHQAQDQCLLQHIEQLYQHSRGLYGSPRIHAALKRQGIACSRKRVARLMQQAGIHSLRQRRRRVHTTDSAHAYPVAPNQLNRQFQALRPNKKWVADITYVPTDQGWLYLAAILDLFSRRLVGWAMSERCDTRLVTQALHMALAHRHPGMDLLHHSDRGSQYAADDYTLLLAQHGIRLSMSRKGDCYDNAVMESFFRTLKAECVHLNHYRSRQQARLSLFEFMEVYYNRQRLHSTLGYLSPVEFEASYSF